MTDWIHHDKSTLLAWIGPIFQASATWITMLSLLPVEASSWLVVLASGAVMLVFFLWALPILYWGLFGGQGERSPLHPLTPSPPLLILFVGSAIALFFAITYFLSMDLTRGARYSFVYFPGVILLLGSSLAACWHADALRFPLFDTLFNKISKRKGKIAVAIIWLMGLLGGMTVCSNLGYQKYYRPDLLVSIIQKTSSVPVLIATTHKTLVQTGEMMGIAWELKRHPLRFKTEFLLAHQGQKDSAIATATLQKALTQLPRPLDVWAVNFESAVALHGCIADSPSLPPVNGYHYRLYRCPPPPHKLENI